MRAGARTTEAFVDLGAGVVVRAGRCERSSHGFVAEPRGVVALLSGACVVVVARGFRSWRTSTTLACIAHSARISVGTGLRVACGKQGAVAARLVADVLGADVAVAAVLRISAGAQTFFALVANGALVAIRAFCARLEGVMAALGRVALVGCARVLIIAVGCVCGAAAAGRADVVLCARVAVVAERRCVVRRECTSGRFDAAVLRAGVAVVALQSAAETEARRLASVLGRARVAVVARVGEDLVLGAEHLGRIRVGLLDVGLAVRTRCIARDVR